MSEWSDYRWMVRTMAKDNGVTLISIARHCGVSHRKLNQILQPNPRSSMERQRNAQCSVRCGVTQFPLAG